MEMADLQKSITEMTEDELRQRLLDIRQSRRTITRAVTTPAKKKQPTIPKNVTAEEIQLLLEMLQENGELEATE